MLSNMISGCDVYAIPDFTIAKDDVDNFIEELRAYHSEFSDFFRRPEPSENFFQYMCGQFSVSERKSTEPIALKIEGAKVRCLQRTVSETVWDDDKIIRKHRELVNKDMGHSEGVLIFDESGFIKKGENSIGVARQYCGTIGKVENSQVGVFAAYASPYGYTLIDKRLFIPEKWFGDEYENKRKKCDLPCEIKFKTKPQSAAEMFLAIDKEGVLPFRYVVADSIYGNSPEFTDAADQFVGKIYFLAISSDTRCWLKEPHTFVERYNYKGRERTKKVVRDTDNKPVKVSELAEGLNNHFWYRRKVSEGAKGPIEYEFAKKEITIAKEGVPWKKVWLIMKRSTEQNPTYYFYISNANVSVRLKLFVWLSGIRWAIEQCFEEAKTELGMDHYEVRKYRGWNHHMITCMLAHFFLWHLKIRLGKKSTCYYFVATEDFA
jgi:SRSO17 transposase